MKTTTLPRTLVLMSSSLAVVAAISQTATAAKRAAPQNTSLPRIVGTPQEGRQLAGDRGNWSGNPSKYLYFWRRCGANGDTCRYIKGANRPGYSVTADDVGRTLRFQVEAVNADGHALATSAPTAVVVAAAKPAPAPVPQPAAPATGCPAGAGPVGASAVTPPARLLVDQQQVEPAVVSRATRQVVVRYHVSDTCGQSVQGALVYATAVPFDQFSVPAEQATDNGGWATLVFRRLPGFPVSARQRLVAIFVRARKTGENPLTGISGRRLFSVRVSL